MDTAHVLAQNQSTGWIVEDVSEVMEGVFGADQGARNAEEDLLSGVAPEFAN
jgi:hypothetical protein